MPGRPHPSSEKYRQRLMLKEATHNVEHSDQDTDIDQDVHEDAQEASYQRRSSSSRSSSRKSSKKKSRKQKLPSSDEESSLTSYSSIPASFKKNKENHRVLSHLSNSMAPSTRNNKKSSKEVELDPKTLKLQELAIENAKLKQQLKEKPSSRFVASVGTLEVRAPKIGKLTDEERKWICRLGDAFKRYNWGKVKFCNTEAKLTMLTANIFDHMPLNQFQDLVGDEREQAKVRWIAENREYVRLAHCNIKNYAQSSLRNWVVKRLSQGKRVPTPEEVLACATRDPTYHTDPEKHEIFDLYHNDLLFKICFKENWDTYYRHYATISGAKNAEDEPCITISTEAFLATLYLNSYKRFLMVHEHQSTGYKDKERKDPRNNTPFIDSDAGQARWGGWNKAGRAHYRDVCKQVTTGRAQSHVEEMEKACLERVRKTVGVDEKTKKKSKKRKAAVVEEESDDEFDCL